MATNFPIPPTFALPFEKSESGKESISPVWLQWFLDVARIFSLLGAGSAGVDHINLSGLQGGSATERYHLTASEHTFAATLFAAMLTPPAAYTQTYSTASRTVPNATFTNLSTTAATNAAPWGFATQAQADEIATKTNALAADVLVLKQLINSLINDAGTLDFHA